MIRAALRALCALAGLALSLGQAILNWLSSGRNLVRVSLFSVIIATCWLALDRCSTASRGISGDPFSTELVQINIGERGYAIPRNYMSHVTRSTTDGSDMTAVLHVLWPGLKPKSEEDIELWRLRDRSTFMRILINTFTGEGHDYLQNALNSASRTEIPFSVAAEPNSFGLLEHLRVRPRGTSDRYFLATDPEYLTPSGHPVVISCPNFVPPRDDVPLELQTLCRVNYLLDDGAGLHFEFEMVNLEHWREIDESVRSLVNSFSR